MSQSTMNTQERDALFMKNVKLRELQASLSERANDLSNGKDSKYNTLFSVLKDTYNLVSENDNEYQILLDETKDQYIRFLGKMSQSKAINNKVKPKISFTTTGTTSKKVEKRKRFLQTYL